ncbi:MAG: DNA-binding protein, partial [Cyanobacteriota bacterium]|nr:DNA-binding protein [Cyanobacteriota bacterium]
LQRFPPETHERLAALAQHSQWLRAQRELAFYGDVEWIPTERYGPLDGERALAAARIALELAESLIAGA